MCTDEKAIRALLDAWFDATMRDDLPALMEMMTDDVVYLAAGRPPLDRAGFAASYATGVGHRRINCSGGFEEILVFGEFAYGRAYLQVAVTQLAGGEVQHLSGYTLTVFRKGHDGRWLLARDASMLAPVPLAVA